MINDIRDKFDLIVRSRDWHPQNHESFAINHDGNPPVYSMGHLSTGEPQMLWPEHCVQRSFGKG